MLSETIDLLFSAPFWVAVLRIATPLILGTLGVLLCERAGVLNLGIEGIMVAGAFAGWLTVYVSGNLWLGVVVAALTGMAFGALHALLTVGLALSQHVSGLGITLLATSLASYAYRVSFPKVDSPPTIQPFGDMSSWLPIPVLNQQTPLTLLALLLVPWLAWLLMRTDWNKRADPAAFQNFDATGQHTPGPDASAVRFLVEQRNVLGFGTETIGTDAGQAAHFRPPYPCHTFMHGAGRYGLQCLANLDLLPPTGALVIAAPLKIMRGSGSPVRALALLA